MEEDPGGAAGEEWSGQQEGEYMGPTRTGSLPLMAPSAPPGSSPPAWLPRATLTVGLMVLGLVAAVWMAGRLQGLVVMVFVAFFVSVGLEPAVQFLARHGWRRAPATAVVFAVAGVAVGGFVAALVPVFVSQAAGLVDNLPRYLRALDDVIAGLGFENVSFFEDVLAGQVAGLESLISRYGSDVAGGVVAAGTTVFGALFNTVTIGLFAFFMVTDGPKMRRTVLTFLPPARQREMLRMWEIAVEKTGGYIYSRAILAVVAAFFTAIALTSLGVPYPAALGMWVGVLSQFVPVVGTYIASVLPVLVALVKSPVTALWVLLALVAYQQVENFLVAPRITARAMAIHPAVSVGAIIAGGSLLGGVGVVLSLPVTATAQAFLSTYLRRHELVESEVLQPEEGEPGGPARS